MSLKQFKYIFKINLNNRLKLYKEIPISLPFFILCTRTDSFHSHMHNFFLIKLFYSTASGINVLLK